MPAVVAAVSGTKRNRTESMGSVNGRSVSCASVCFAVDGLFGFTYVPGRNITRTGSSVCGIRLRAVRALPDAMIPRSFRGVMFSRAVEMASDS